MSEVLNVKPPIMVTPNKEHNTTNFQIMDTFQYTKSKTDTSEERATFLAKDKMACPDVSVI